MRDLVAPLHRQRHYLYVCFLLAGERKTPAFVSAAERVWKNVRLDRNGAALLLSVILGYNDTEDEKQAAQRQDRVGRQKPVALWMSKAY